MRTFIYFQGKNFDPDREENRPEPRRILSAGAAGMLSLGGLFLSLSRWIV